MTPEQASKLREAFPPHLIGKLPKPTKKDNPKGKCKECDGWHGLPAVHLDYVGHATVTDRLLEVDPEWTWEPVAFDTNGAPLLDRNGQGQPVGLWLRLTVGGVTRLGYGSVDPGGFDPVKQLISDGIRNAAMRFGVALSLWSKEEFDAPEETAKKDRARKGTRHDPAPDSGEDHQGGGGSEPETVELETARAIYQAIVRAGEPGRELALAYGVTDPKDCPRLNPVEGADLLGRLQSMLAEENTVPPFDQTPEQAELQGAS